VIIVRSVLFGILFQVNLVLHLIAAVAVLPGPRPLLIAVARSWAHTGQWLLRVVCDITVEWRGLDKIPPGALIVAAKHQSVWEIVALTGVFGDPAYLVKRELTGIPLIGWCLRTVGAIPVGRAGDAAGAMQERARRELEHGRRIVVFPEGACRAPGAPPAYGRTVADLYEGTGAPCLPVALDSGLVWPHRSLKRHPGTVRVEFLDIIPPGLPAGVFLQRLQGEIEAATARLIAGRVPQPKRG
jgi:1-acyl-sn-glycerol-3-phosphate acyltransferase